jgi:GNAT superfamily N-acetyltransferase
MVMGEIRLEFAGVDEAHWGDLAALFEGRGGPHGCWCMVWRDKPPAARHGAATDRKALLKKALRARVGKGTPVGILGYDAGVPIAWCSVAPRVTYRPVGGLDDADDGVEIWSIVCFFVKRAYRGQGLTDRLLKAAIGYAADHGAGIVEAYPVDPGSPSYRFMGFVGVFERAGFEKVGTAGSRRHVMRLTLR